jgi:hypothetical protein
MLSAIQAFVKIILLSQSYYGMIDDSMSRSFKRAVSDSAGVCPTPATIVLPIAFKSLYGLPVKPA